MNISYNYRIDSFGIVSEFYLLKALLFLEIIVASGASRIKQENSLGIHKIYQVTNQILQYKLVINHKNHQSELLFHIRNTTHSHSEVAV